MRGQTIFAAALGLALMCTAATATPITTLTPITSNGSDVYAVYVFSQAHDTLNLSEIAPNSISNIFCNKSNGGCTASAIGETIHLGNTDPGIVFGLTDVTHSVSFATNALGPDGFAHDIVSATVDAGNAAAVAAAFATFGQGALDPAAAASIGLLGETPGTIVTFVAWEDTLSGDYDYNDLIFAFTDPIPRGAVPEPMSLAMFGVGFVFLAGFSRRTRKA